MRDYFYPIYSLDNKVCIHCDSKSVVVLNKFDNEVKNENKEDHMYPIYKMKCNKCGREFYIRWEKNDKKMIPIAVSGNDIDEFVENLKQRLQK